MLLTITNNNGAFITSDDVTLYEERDGVLNLLSFTGPAVASYLSIGQNSDNYIFSFQESLNDTAVTTTLNHSQIASYNTAISAKLIFSHASQQLAVIVNASPGDDVINSSDSDDRIYGDNGNDTINGLYGNDKLYGNDGSDLIHGNNGNDSIWGHDNDDTLFGDDGNDWLSGGVGNDDIWGGYDNDKISGGNDNDSIKGGDGDDTLSGGKGNDTLLGDTDLQTLSLTSLLNTNETATVDYNEANTTFTTHGTLNGGQVISFANANDYAVTYSLYYNGWKYIDQFTVAANSETYLIAPHENASYRAVQSWSNSYQEQSLTTEFTSNIFLTVESDSGLTGNDILYGNDGDDTLYGHDGNDILDGGDGDDDIWGGDGDDDIFASFGDDTINGGNGTDTLFFAADIVDVGYWTGGQDNVTIYDDNGNWNHSISGVEYFNFDGQQYTFEEFTSYNKQYISEIKLAFKWDNTSYITKSTYVQFNTLDTQEVGKSGEGIEFASFDHASGQLDVTLLNIEDNPEQVNISTTWGSDDITVDNQSSSKIVAFLRGGNDAFTLSSDHDSRIYAGSGKDEIYTDQGDDEIYGENGNDEIHSGAGNDLIYGDYGKDIIYGGDDSDRIYGGNDKDTLYGGEGRDTIKGDSGNDIIYGEDGHDFLYGGANNDILYGGAERDKLFGNDGRDTLIGGEGNDVLSGGEGRDVYLYETFDGIADEILDFETGHNEDRLDISDILSDYGFNENQDNINDFLALTVIDSSQSEILIDQTGAGDSWARLALINDDLSGLTLDNLIDYGNVVV